VDTNLSTTTIIQKDRYFSVSLQLCTPIDELASTNKMGDQEYQTWDVEQPPYLNIHCSLGEGPYYEKATNSLRFVDIQKKQLHTVSLAQGPESLQTLQLDVPITVTADIEGVDPAEKILVGLKYGIAILDRKTGEYTYLTKFHDGEGNARLRSNDGAVDPHGRFWLGTMTDFGLGPFKPEGKHASAGAHHRPASDDAVESGHVGAGVGTAD
jgi:sugar lactone lactonase YvrE